MRSIICTVLWIKVLYKCQPFTIYSSLTDLWDHLHSVSGSISSGTNKEFQLLHTSLSLSPSLSLSQFNSNKLYWHGEGMLTLPKHIIITNRIFYLYNVQFWLVYYDCAVLAGVLWLCSFGWCVVTVQFWLVYYDCAVLAGVLWLCSFGWCVVTVQFWLVCCDCAVLPVVLWLCSFGWRFMTVQFWLVCYDSVQLWLVCCDCSFGWCVVFQSQVGSAPFPGIFVYSILNIEDATSTLGFKWGRSLFICILND